MEPVTREQALAIMERGLRKLRECGEKWHAGELARVRKFMVESFAEQDRLIIAVTPGVTPAVVVHVEGGIVQDVVSTVSMNYTVVDYDTEGADDEDLIVVPQPDGTADEDAVGHTSPCTVNAPWVQRVAPLMRTLS